MEQQPAKSPGNDKEMALPKSTSLEAFTQIVEADRETTLENLRNDYKERANLIKSKAEQIVAEYTIMGQIGVMNNHADQLTPDICLQFERQLANLGHEQMFGSIAIGYYGKRYGEKLIMGMICDTIEYYTKSLRSTNRMDNVEIMQLAAELIVRHKELKYLELVYVLHNGTRGRYGKNFNRIDKEVIWGWFMQYFEESAAWLETKRVNERVEGSNVANLVDPADKLRKELKQKFDIQQQEFERAKAQQKELRIRQEELDNAKNKAKRNE